MSEPGVDLPPREGEHRPPIWHGRAYHCPYSGVYSPMAWAQLQTQWNLIPCWWATCDTCKDSQLWFGSGADRGRMLVPNGSQAARPHAEMPPEVRRDYEEARNIASASPRGACALLRLATEKLVQILQPEGGSLNNRIGLLRQAGLRVEIVEALDTLRVIGAEAVHPLTLDLIDDHETAAGLFALLNFVVEDQISQPRKAAEMAAKMPPNKVVGIEVRDRKALGK